MATTSKCFANSRKVLDNAIVNDGKPVSGSSVRVGVDVVWWSVGSPARVTYAHCAQGLEFPTWASKSATFPFFFLSNRDPSNSIVAIPALSYPLYSGRLRPSITMGKAGFGTNVCNNSTHVANFILVTQVKTSLALFSSTAVPFKTTP